MAKRLTPTQIRFVRQDAIEAQREAAACHLAARGLIDDPSLDPDFPACAILVQQAGALASRRAMRLLFRLLDAA